MIHEIQAKTLLRPQKRIDSWFLSRFGMNLYRGCVHNCRYCDGRSEKYNVNGVFGEDVEVKVNAIDLLKKELASLKRRGKLGSGFVMVGGGVGDSYQPVEEQYELTRKTLEILLEYKLPVHMLTKSTLIQRDLDLLQALNEQSQVLVSMSFSTVDPKIAQVFEPGVPSPQKRLAVLKQCKQAGLSIGMFLMPVIPFITDTAEQMESSLKQAKTIGMDYLVFSGMTLKEGRQKECFMDVVNHHFPQVVPGYTSIYTGDRWGNTIPTYYQSIHATFATLLQAYPLPPRIPYELFSSWVNENDVVVVILDHIDYLLRLRGQKSPYGFAAYSISKVKEPLSMMKTSLRSIKGVGVTTEKIIREILETKTCQYYTKLMHPYLQ